MTVSTLIYTSLTRATSSKGKLLLFAMLAATLLLGGGTYALGILGAKMGHTDTSVKRKGHQTQLP